MNYHRVGAITACCVVVCAIAWAQQTGPFRGRIDVVQVTVAVTDASGRLITGLTQQDFQVFEDGVEQTITQFTDKRVPVSLGMLLDASDSMRGQAVIDAREAFDRFVGDLLLTEDGSSSPPSTTCRASSRSGRRPRRHCGDASAI